MTVRRASPPVTPGQSWDVRGLVREGSVSDHDRARATGRAEWSPRGGRPLNRLMGDGR
ncbi:hypothetical protein SFR_1291 [Streptomyces sp. FR-008]|nr:hypothetical protein SFR_1291 [Streptomyces sp. FR-008]